MWGGGWGLRKQSAMKSYDGVCVCVCIFFWGGGGGILGEVYLMENPKPNPEVYLMEMPIQSLLDHDVVVPYVLGADLKRAAITAASSDRYSAFRGVLGVLGLGFSF